MSGHINLNSNDETRSQERTEEQGKKRKLFPEDVEVIVIDDEPSMETTRKKFRLPRGASVVLVEDDPPATGNVNGESGSSDQLSGSARGSQASSPVNGQRSATKSMRKTQKISEAEKHYSRALKFYATGENLKTQVRCSLALECNPDHLEAKRLFYKSRNIVYKRNLGNESFAKGELDHAYELYAEALMVDPENTKMNAILRSRMANVCIKRGVLSEAIRELDKALVLDESCVEALRRRADCYIKMEKHEQAFHDLEAAFNLNKSHQIWQQLESARQKLESLSRQNHYQILKIPANATDIEIKKAYRRLALQYHPDKNDGFDSVFKRIVNAYNTLIDPAKRRNYNYLNRF